MSEKAMVLCSGGVDSTTCLALAIEKHGKENVCALSEKGVCVSVKSACSADGLPSRAVFAVSRDRRNALSSWRISLSHLTTDAEIHEFLAVFDACYHELVK